MRLFFWIFPTVLGCECKAITWLLPLIHERSRAGVFNFYFCRPVILIFQDSCVPLCGMLSLYKEHTCVLLVNFCEPVNSAYTTDYQIRITRVGYFDFNKIVVVCAGWLCHDWSIACSSLQDWICLILQLFILEVCYLLECQPHPWSVWMLLV